MEASFKMDNCWYKDVCIKYDSEICKDTLCVRYAKMKYLMESSLLTQYQQKIVQLVPDKCDLKAFAQLSEIKNNINEFVEMGKNLLITSPNCGNGKTQWSIKIMQKFFDNIWQKASMSKPSALFIRVSEFLNMCKSTFNRENKEYDYIIDNIKNVDLVIWDDIGIKSLSDFEHEILFTYINSRIENHKSNIYTANAINANLETILGERLYSRVVTSSIKVELNGKDRRGIEQ